MRQIRLAIKVSASLIMAFVAATVPAQVRDVPHVPDVKPPIDLKPDLQIKQQPDIQIQQRPDIQIQQRPNTGPVVVALPPDPPREVTEHGHCDYKKWQCVTHHCAQFGRYSVQMRQCLYGDCGWVDRNRIDDVVEWVSNRKK